MQRGMRLGLPLADSSEPVQMEASRPCVSSVSMLLTEAILDGVQLRRCTWLCVMNEEEHARALWLPPKGVAQAPWTEFPVNPHIAALYGELSTPKSLRDVLRAPCGVMGVDDLFDALLLPRCALMCSDGAPGTIGDAARLDAELVDNGGVVPLSLLQLQCCVLLRRWSRRAGTAIGSPVLHSDGLQKVQKCKLLDPAPIMLR